MMDIEQIKRIKIDDLIGLPVTKYAERGLEIYQQMQSALQLLAPSEDCDSLTNTKIGTVLTLSVLKKIADKKIMPTAFTQDDWADIAATVKDIAVYMEDQDYSVFVFDLYTNYIHASAARLQDVAPDEKRAAIDELADELQAKKQLLQDGEIGEVAYTEDCLWICLEAMIKSLSCMVYMTGDEAKAEFAQAAAMYAFEYGRYRLYAKEQALVTEYIENQYQLDEELQAKFEAYKAELEAETNQFMGLIDNAFDPQFRTSLHASAALARAAGVAEEEILKSVEDVDSFFLD